MWRLYISRLTQQPGNKKGISGNVLNVGRQYEIDAFSELVN